MRTAMTLNETITQKLLTAKTSVETGTKRTSQFNKTETTERKPRAGKLGNGGEKPEKLMKNAHAYRIERGNRAY
jgi:DNA-binding transcriptional regulator of glucitol operon